MAEIAEEFVRCVQWSLSSTVSSNLIELMADSKSNRLPGTSHVFCRLANPLLKDMVCSFKLRGGSTSMKELIDIAVELVLLGSKLSQDNRIKLVLP